MAKRKKTGGGSRKGKPNKSTAELKDILDKAVDWNVVAKKLFELVKGVTVEEERKDGSTSIYTKPPNETAAKTLLEFRFGKAPQSMTLTGKDGEQLFELVIGQKAD